MACDTPLIIDVKGRVSKIPVPCGKCPPCKLRRVNDWVFRLKQEDKVSSSSCFITLTYDTKHVPISGNGFMTLQKRDYQLFMKRLRKRFPDSKLKYYACGEYGSKTNRPHYHAILFNCSDPNAIHEAWGLGQTHIGTASGDSMAYCLKYINKPGRIPMHRRDDRAKEFSTQSKNLGASYLSKSIVQHHRSRPNDLRVQNNQFAIAMPRYYRYRIFDETERKAQLPHIKSAVDAATYQRMLDHERSGSKIHFDDYENSRKFGRYKSFYSFTNQKRDKI